ncbi:lipid II flippase Amj family protein [Leptolyngbya sp. 15MV]|nr:lipid II flippase Amj family protein [Leptolyngbya sp. 15MV]
MFDPSLIAILILTGVINLIGALAYAARIAGVRTRRIAMSFALFNILLLFSRTSNSFLGPFLAKRIETRLHAGTGEALFLDMQLVLGAASLATLLGILAVPTAQRVFSAAIDRGHQRARVPAIDFARQARLVPSQSALALRRVGSLPIASSHQQGQGSERERRTERQGGLQPDVGWQVRCRT